MRIVLDVTKSVEENAQHYFEQAKRARRKAKGAEKAIIAYKEPRMREVPAPRVRTVRKREWYEKYRWCRSSDGLLMIAGRDATTNEILIKKHTQEGDIVFHTDMAGSPFVVVKADGEVPDRTIDEAAQFCASFSRAWKNGLSALEVFRVAPDQVTKEAQSGEYLPKGAFMIRGKTTYRRSPLRVAIGIDPDGRVVAGPPSAVAQQCEQSVELLQGNAKSSDVAKEVRRRIGGDLDEILAALPPGGCAIPK